MPTAGKGAISLSSDPQNSLLLQRLNACIISKSGWTNPCKKNQQGWLNAETSSLSSGDSVNGQEL